MAAGDQKNFTHQAYNKTPPSACGYAGKSTYTTSKIQESTHLMQSDVPREFCAAYCCAWHGTWCGTIYAPDYRKGMCLRSRKEIEVGIEALKRRNRNGSRANRTSNQ